MCFRLFRCVCVCVFFAFGVVGVRSFFGVMQVVRLGLRPLRVEPPFE